MKRKGLYRPSIEDSVEISGIETLHPGGMALTRRTAEVTELTPKMEVLDVSSGRGTQAVFYASEFGVNVVGIDLSEQMLKTAGENVQKAGLADRVSFLKGDSQSLPFENDRFDVAINECAVGIPDDSQSVLDQMVRVVKPGGRVAIHESTWKKRLSADEKEEFSDRYGTTPLEHDEWIAMLQKAGVSNIRSESDPWSKPEMFWKVRKNRNVTGPGKVLSPLEKLQLTIKVLGRFGPQGVFRAFQNEKIFYRAILDGKLGYSLYWGRCL